MSGLLGVPMGGRGSGRVRYARAMLVHARGGIDAAVLEAYRVAAAHDGMHPALFLADRGLAVPDGAAERMAEEREA